MLLRMSSASNILVIAPAGLYEFVETLPALALIRQQHRDAALWLCAGPDHGRLIDPTITTEVLIPLGELVLLPIGFRHALDLFKTQFSHVYEFNESRLVHLLATVPAHGQKLISVRGRKHPGFRLLRLQDQLGELLAASGTGSLGPPRLEPEPGFQEGNDLTIALAADVSSMMRDREWLEVRKFVDGMARRGLEPRILLAVDDAIAPAAVADLPCTFAPEPRDSAAMFLKSRLVLVLDRDLAALSGATGAATLVLAPHSVDRLKYLPRGDHVQVLEIGYPIEIKSENLTSTALKLFS